MLDGKKVFERFYALRIPILIGILLILFSALSPGFFSFRTLEKTLLLLPSDGIIAIGMTLVILIGELDVSVGSIAAVSGLLMIRLMPFGALVSILLTIICGGCIGLINGVIINRFKVNSLIATISMGFVLSGVALFLSEKTIYFENIFLTNFGNNSLWVFPYSTLFYFGLVLILQLMLRGTSFGIKLYAVGGSRLSSAYTGIHVRRFGTVIFILSGFFASLGGVFLSMRLATASPLYGSDTAIYVITAVLLGGTSLSGGQGNVVRTLLGILLLSLLTKGFNQVQIPAYFQRMVVGAILIFLLYVGKRMERGNGLKC